MAKSSRAYRRVRDRAGFPGQSVERARAGRRRRAQPLQLADVGVFQSDGVVLRDFEDRSANCDGNTRLHTALRGSVPGGNCTNLDFAEWTSVLAEAKMTTGLLERLTHHCHIVFTGNESHRYHHSSDTAGQRIKPREAARKCSKPTTADLA